MSDQDLRALERRAQASGAATDQAAWLQARARAGELAPSRLALLAHLGCDGARALLSAAARSDPTPPPEPPRPPVLPHPVQSYLTRLWHHGPDEAAQQADRMELRPWVRRITELAPDDWALEGRAALAAAPLLDLDDAGQELFASLRPWLRRALNDDDDDDDAVAEALLRLHARAQALGQGMISALIEATPGPASYPLVGEPPGGALREVVSAVGEDQAAAARAAIEAALVPWLLGTGHP